jgi:predicted nucleotidyltransferase
MSTTLLQPATARGRPSRPVEPLRAIARRLLGSLLNLEWPTRTGALLQPFATRLRPALAADAHDLAARTGLGTVTPATVVDLERLLARTFTRLPRHAVATAATTVVVPAAPPALRAFTEPRFGALAAAARRLTARTGCRVLLHGSLATDDWTAYRDADLLLLVDGATCRDAKALRRLRRAVLPLLRALFAFDPLQHHGLFVQTDDELAAWPEHVLPIATLARAVDLGGHGFSLTLRPAHDLAAARAEFDWLEAYFAAAAPPRDAYGWKAFASVLMLVPALFLGAMGEPVWKGDSFARVRAIVPPELWQAQEWAARLRNGFHDATPAWVRGLQRICPNPRLPGLLGRRFVHAPADLLPADPRDLLRQAHALVCHLRSRLPSSEPPR